MIPNQSKQTYSVLEKKVELDILQKGWVAIPCPAESQFDVIVDMGVEDGQRKLVTIQVKQKPRTTSRPRDGKSDNVHGKIRNSYSYYDMGIDYLATEENGKIVYIHREDFHHLTENELKHARRTLFPKNEDIYIYRKPVWENDDDSGPLKDFFG